MNNSIETKTALLDSVISIYEKLENSKLSKEALDSACSDLNVVQNYLGCNQ